MNSKNAFFFLLFLLFVILMFNRETITNNAGSISVVESLAIDQDKPQAEIFSLDNINNLGFMKRLKEEVGETGYNIIVAGTVFFLTAWIIGAFWTLFTRNDPAKEPVMKLGISGSLFLMMILFTIGVILINQIWFKGDEGKIRSQVEVGINQIDVGESITVPMSLTTKAKVTFDMTRPSREGLGKSFWACPEVISPEKTTDFIFFRMLSKKPSEVHYVVIDEDSRKKLLEFGIQQIKVKFTKTLAGNKVEDNPCPYLKF